MTQPRPAASGDHGPPLVLVEAAYDSPLVQRLVAEVQAEYVVRYGGPDQTPLDPAEFAPPRGVFLVALLDGEPVGTAGLRAGADPADGSGQVELKRMYVRAGHRRRGHARRLLAAVEERARTMGHRRLVLETGTLQPEAVALYRSAGYADTAPFGHYACAEHSVHLAKDIGSDPVRATASVPRSAGHRAPAEVSHEAGSPES